MYYDREYVSLEFEVGEKVLLSTKHLQLDGSDKLLPRFVGPFVVQAKVGRLVYQLNLDTRYARTHPVFYISLLHRYHACGDRHAIFTLITIQDEQEWPVDQILRHQCRGQIQWEYLVSYVGYN